MTHVPTQHLDPKTADFYRAAMRALTRSAVPYLVGGAYAFQRYAGIERHTKDFDVFVARKDFDAALAALDAAGYRTDFTHPHWLGKAFQDEDYLDVIFGSGNGAAPVDDEWFLHSVEDEVLGVPARLCPAEEIIWSKSYIMERERFDGADIAHLLRARGDRLDWTRLQRRFERHPHLLLTHLLLYRFVFPDAAAQVPQAIVDRLFERVRSETADAASNGEADGHVCRGTLLSRLQYLVDVHERGYRDARLAPEGGMTAEQIDQWTAAAFREH